MYMRLKAKDEWEIITMVIFRVKVIVSFVGDGGGGDDDGFVEEDLGR